MPTRRMNLQTWMPVKIIASLASAYPNCNRSSELLRLILTDTYNVLSKRGDIPVFSSSTRATEYLLGKGYPTSQLHKVDSPLLIAALQEDSMKEEGRSVVDSVMEEMEKGGENDEKTEN